MNSWVGPNNAYNSLPSSPTRLSPFHCCIGYQPPLFSVQESEVSVSSVQALIERCQRTWRREQNTMCKTRERTCRAANRHRSKAPRYVCGQRMWLSTRNLSLQSPSLKVVPTFLSWSLVQWGCGLNYHVIYNGCIRFSTSRLLNPLFAHPPPLSLLRVLQSIESRNCWLPALGKGVFST